MSARRPIPIALRRPAASVAAIYFVVYGSWLLTHWGPSDRAYVGDTLGTILNVWVAVLCWRAAARTRIAPPVGSAWRWLSAGASSYAVGNVAQFVQEVILHRHPYPSIADVFYLSMYPLVFVGLLRFPTTRASRTQRFQTILDAALLAIGGAAVVWYVELGPTVAQVSHGPVLSDIFSILYPVGDLVLIGGLAGVANRGTLASSRTVLRFFATGIGLFVTADLVLGYITVKLGQTYSGGDWLDPVWSTGLAAWGVAAMFQRRPERAEIERLAAAQAAWWRPTWLPFLVPATGLAILLATAPHDILSPIFSVAIATSVAYLLLGARQIASQRELIATQVELHRAHDELASLATTDPLTGLPNHRSLVALIDRELDRVERYGRPLAVAFIDVDHFKALNDTAGHAGGDAVLRELGEVVRATLRTSDTVGRWGGEEFLLVLPETEGEEAVRAAERVRDAVAGHRFASIGGAHVTCSIGVATSAGEGTERDELVARADRAMYAAKRLGRDQVIAAADRAAAALAAEARGGDREHEALLGAVEALAAVADARTGARPEPVDVGALACALAEELADDEHLRVVVGLAARLRDIGTVSVPDAVLAKPGPLTEAEWTLLRHHPILGAEIAARIPRLRSVAPVIRSHHERVDGTGYPEGLRREAIPLGARILAVADAFGAMLAERPYRPARSAGAALDELRRGAGTQFDPKVVAALERVLGADGGDGAREAPHAPTETVRAA